MAGRSPGNHSRKPGAGRGMVAGVKPVSFRVTGDERRELEGAAAKLKSTVSQVARDRYLVGAAADGAGSRKKGGKDV